MAQITVKVKTGVDANDINTKVISNFLLIKFVIFVSNNYK